MKLKLITGLFILAFTCGFTAVNHHQTNVHKHVVQQGEGLWSICERYAPDADIRKVIYDTEQHNHITALIYPGQVIEVVVKQ